MIRAFGVIALLTVLPVRAQSDNPQTLFASAVAAQQRGDDASAVQMYRQLLASHPDATPLRVNLGAAYARLKRFDEAITQYRAVLVADPGNFPVRINLALALEAQGRLKQAAQELEVAHRARPGDAQAAILLGGCYNRLQRYPDAVAVLTPIETAQAEDSDLTWQLGSALIHAGRVAEGLQRIDRVAQKTSSTDAYVLAGRARLALGEYDLASSDADAAARLDLAAVGLRTLRGMLLEQTGDYTGAESALRQALQANPEDFDAHFYLGAILYFNRQLPEARGHVERALQLRPASSQARYELALVLRSQSQFDAALRNLQVVIRQNPEWVQPHIELSSLYFRMHRQEDGGREREIVDRLTAEHAGPAPGPMP